MCTAIGKWLHLLPRMLSLRLKNGYLPKPNLLELVNVYDSPQRNLLRSDIRSRRRVAIPWERDSQKNMFSLRLHDMSTFQLCQRQALQNNSFVSCPSSSYSSWRPFDFTLSSLDAATRERDWLVSRGSLTLWIDQFVISGLMSSLISIWGLLPLLTSIVFVLVFGFSLPYLIWLYSQDPIIWRCNFNYIDRYMKI